MATKSPVGWLILAFALAIPGVLFYQWYTHLDLEKKRALTTKVRLKDTDLFRNSPKQDKLVNPIAPVTVPVAASTAAATSASTATSTAAGDGQVAAASPIAPTGGAAPPTPAVQPAPEEDDPNVAQVSSAPVANPFQAWRDPTLSPHDLVEIERLELEKQLALEELKDRALNGPKGPPKAPPIQIEKLIDLQGIVSVEGGNKAIVNNEVVAEGEVVKTKSGPVKVLRITMQKVIFSHKNKTFFKAVNR